MDFICAKKICLLFALYTQAAFEWQSDKPEWMILRTVQLTKEDGKQQMLKTMFIII